VELMAVSAPVAVAIEVVATQPVEADDAALAHVRRQTGVVRMPVTYVVKVRLAAVLQATGSGWALYVDDFRIPKYWQYAVGIFFKIFDPRFFSEHEGGAVRFSADAGVSFVETGLTLSGADVSRDTADASSELPTQQEVLRQ
jgi:hypothetical protein